MIKRTIVCNKCGKEIIPSLEKEQYTYEKRLGYGSKYDGDFLRIDLCEKCAEEFIKTLKVSPVEGATMRTIDDDYNMMCIPTES